MNTPEIRLSNKLVTIIFTHLEKGDLPALTSVFLKEFPAVESPFNMIFDFSQVPSGYNFLNFKDIDSLRIIYDRVKALGLHSTVIVSPPSLPLKDIFIMSLSGKGVDEEEIIAATSLREAEHILKGKNKL